MSTSATAVLSRRELSLLVLRWLGGLLALVAVIALLSRVFRRPLEAFGHAFLETLGVPGMLIGTFLADAFSFPIPPQFYMMVAVTSDVPERSAFVAIGAGSLLGGFVGYRLAGRLARFEFIAQRLANVRAVAGHAFERFGGRGAVVASLLPIPYSVLCYLAGLHGAPRSVFLVLCLCRIPRLVLFFYLVHLGWSVE